MMTPIPGYRDNHCLMNEPGLDPFELFDPDFDLTGVASVLGRIRTLHLLCCIRSSGA